MIENPLEIYSIFGIPTQHNLEQIYQTVRQLQFFFKKVFEYFLVLLQKHVNPVLFECFENRAILVVYFAVRNGHTSDHYIQ